MHSYRASLQKVLRPCASPCVPPMLGSSPPSPRLLGSWGGDGAAGWGEGGSEDAAILELDGCAMLDCEQNLCTTGAGLYCVVFVDLATCTFCQLIIGGTFNFMHMYKGGVNVHVDKWETSSRKVMYKLSRLPLYVHSVSTEPLAPAQAEVIDFAAQSGFTVSSLEKCGVLVGILQT